MNDMIRHPGPDANPDSGSNPLPPGGASAESYVFTPPIDIYETDEGLVLEADLPGVSLETLDLEVQNNRLTLFGRVKSVVPADATPRYCEYQIGDFLRSFILSDEVDHDRISATLTQGVLKVTLPKAARETRRKIEVVPE